MDKGYQRVTNPGRKELPNLTSEYTQIASDLMMTVEDAAVWD